MQGVINLTRWILSICLLIGSLVHIDIFSIIYALLFLTIPWAFIHSSVVRLRFFFIISLISLITSTGFLLIMGSLHIFSMTNKGENVFSIQCSFNVRILQHFGLILWAHTTNKVVFTSILIINVITICSSLATLITHNCVGVKEPPRQQSSKSIHSDHFQSIPLRIRPMFIYFRSIILLALIHSCGCLVPSILSAFYFFVALGLALWWALGKHFGRAYLHIIRLLQIYSILHLLIIYLYQYPFLEQSIFAPNTQLIRLLGLRSLYKDSCAKNSNRSENNNWIVYLQPFVILILYWITIYEYHLTRKYHQRMQTVVLFPQNNSQTSNTFHLHSITDLFWIGPSNDHSQSNTFYKTNSLIVALISFILSKAYMLSIMSMLLWSITYHSYLTLPYLILACSIWLLPNTKYWCQFCSLFFCIYAYVLLIINYIQLLNLIHEEFSWGIHEIEFFYTKYENNISIRFYLKCSIKFIYTLLLLLSLRQRTKERAHQRHRHSKYLPYFSSIELMVVGLDISSSSVNLYEHIELISPVRYIDKTRVNQSTSRLNRIRCYLQSQWSSIYYEIYCIFYMGYAHIWFYNLFYNWSRLLTIILIFTLSYGSGSIPVAYRIVYMGFFLHYHLCYSLNQRLWNLYLFPFYITLILYSMIVLFIIYIYQFQEFQTLKTSICFAHIKCELLLSSLGIRYANHNILGTELFTPTAFIICIVMHIHFFHRQEKKSYHPSRLNLKHTSSIQMLDFIQYFEKRWKALENLLWSLCEVYMGVSMGSRQPIR